MYTQLQKPLVVKKKYFQIKPLFNPTWMVMTYQNTCFFFWFFLSTRKIRIKILIPNYYKMYNMYISE